MKFKDAAYEILKAYENALHYNHITELALEKGILDTAGETPAQSMGAALYTDTLKPDSLFKRGDDKGTFLLKRGKTIDIQQKVEDINKKVREDLLKYLKRIPPEKFEELIRLLLEEMGFDETIRTSYSNDKGVDVRGVLQTNAISKTNVAIQVKRWKNNVESKIVRDLRGSLNLADGEQGLIITTSDFTSGAKEEAQVPGRTPISLINGNQLVDLLIDYKVGIKLEEYIVPIIDNDYWTEVLGINLIPVVQQQNPISLNFPLSIFARHKNKEYQALLMDLGGRIIFDNQEFDTPTTAAKKIVTDWKEVNGWDFWKYQDPMKGKKVKIGTLRKSENARDS